MIGSGRSRPAGRTDGRTVKVTITCLHSETDPVPHTSRAAWERLSGADARHRQQHAARCPAAEVTAADLDKLGAAEVPDSQLGPVVDE